jgi:hypothetical protein
MKNGLQHQSGFDKIFYVAGDVEFVGRNIWGKGVSIGEAICTNHHGDTAWGVDSEHALSGNG